MSAREQIRKGYPCLREALDLILLENKGNHRTASGKVTKEPPCLAGFTCIPEQYLRYRHVDTHYRAYMIYGNDFKRLWSV